jgi:hypothetical protein
MSRIGTRIATIAAAAGGLATAYLALSPTAAADSAPVIPALPGINVVQQLANAPAMASQLLQNAATMLRPAPAASATPPAPTATASLNLPPLSAPMNNAVGTVPTGQSNLPTSSIPLLSQLGLPSNLSSLPLSNLGGAPAVPAAPAMPGEPALPPSLNPFSALP